MDKGKKDIFVEGAIAPVFIADRIAKHASKNGIGAHSIFLGQVRADKVGDKTVSSIEYSCYGDLANVKMAEIRESIFDRYHLTCMHVYHSLGTVHVGEICLFVFASSAHRSAAISACEEVVDRLKKELPIWGKELFEDESHQWKVNTNRNQPQ
ncbi:molybdenum cofactor biosynthesis protein MoaE [Parapedobacter sp.]